MREKHMQGGRCTMGESDVFLLNQREKVGRVKTTWIDLFDAHGSRDIWETPGMNVEHRRHRHIDVFTVKTLLRSRTGERSHGGECVQHNLPVAEVNTLRLASCAS